MMYVHMGGETIVNLDPRKEMLFENQSAWCVYLGDCPTELRVPAAQPPASDRGAQRPKIHPCGISRNRLKKGHFSVLVAPPKQARAARPRAPQAPEAARSAAAGGGQQVREIKRHFRFRGFATNIEIRYKST